MQVYPTPDFIKPIVIGSLGGLAFLVVLTAGLYKVKHSSYCFLVDFTTSKSYYSYCTVISFFFPCKAGFFNSHYKWTLNQEEDGPGPGTDEGAPTTNTYL